MPAYKAMLTLEMESPPLLARARIQGVEHSVVAADVDEPGVDRRRGGYPAAGLELPALHAVRRIHGIDGMVAAAEIHGPIGDHRRGQHRTIRFESPFQPVQNRHPWSRVYPAVHCISPKHHRFGVRSG